MRIYKNFYFSIIFNLNNLFNKVDNYTLESKNIYFDKYINLKIVDDIYFPRNLYESSIFIEKYVF